MNNDDHLLLRPAPIRFHSREDWEEEQARHAIAHHLSMRLVDDGYIARTPGELRAATRIVQRIGRSRGYIAHAFADTHLHAVLGGSREEAGIFARCVEGVLRKFFRIAVPFERCRIRPVNDARHFRNVVPYVFTQSARHDAAFDEPRDGSSLLDVLGMRVGAEWIAERFAALLPRVGRDALLRMLGAPELDAVQPDPVHVPAAAAAALGVTSLHGLEAENTRARRAAVHLVDRLAPGCDVARALDIPSRSVTRYRSQEPDIPALRASLLQVKHRVLLARRHAAVDQDVLAASAENDNVAELQSPAPALRRS